MRNKLFDIIEGEPIVTAPLINLGPFKKLWAQDHSDDKSMYKKWLLWVYYYSDYRSAFYEMDENEKVKEINREVFERVSVALPSKIKSCVEAYKKHNTLVEQRTMDSAKSMADQITRNINDQQKNTEVVGKVLRALDDDIQKAHKAGETLVAAEILKQKMELEKDHLNLMKTSVDMIPKVKVMVESMIETREIIEKNIDKVDDSNKALPNFIIDAFLAKKDSEFIKD